MKAMKNHWIFKAYMGLPLWGKIAIPAVAVFLFLALLNFAKMAVGIAALGAIAYGVIWLFNRFNKGKE